MTLILGINCKDGIVMASDGVNTTTSIQDWVHQPANKKIEIYDDLIIGCAGSLSLNDKIMSELNQLYVSNDKFKSLSIFEIIKKIEYRIKQAVQEEIKKHKEYIAIFKKASELETKEQIGCLMAFPCNDKLMLIHFDWASGSATRIEDVTFSAIGWFSLNVLSYLTFIQKNLCKDSQLTKEEGIFSAMLAMKHAIDFSALKISEPIKIYLLHFQNGKSLCQELTGQELQLYENKVLEFESYLKKFN